MQKVSPGTGNKWAGQYVAEGNNIGTYVIVPGIVNVEQKISSREEHSGIGCKAVAETGQTGYLSPNGGVAS